MDLTHDEIVLLADALLIKSRLLFHRKSYFKELFKSLKKLPQAEIDASIVKNDLLYAKLISVLYEGKDTI